MKFLKNLKHTPVVFSIAVFLIFLILSSIGIQWILSSYVPNISFLNVLILMGILSVLMIGVVFTLGTYSWLKQKKYDDDLFNYFTSSDKKNILKEKEGSSIYNITSDHEDIEYDESNRPFCSGCFKYMDEKGGYAFNREQRRFFKKNK